MSLKELFRQLHLSSVKSIPIMDDLRLEHLFIAVNAVENVVIRVPEDRWEAHRVWYGTSETLFDLGIGVPVLRSLQGPFILEYRYIKGPVIFAHAWEDFYKPIESFLVHRTDPSFRTVLETRDVSQLKVFFDRRKMFCKFAGYVRVLTGGQPYYNLAKSYLRIWRDHILK